MSDIVEEANQCAEYLTKYADIVSKEMYGGTRPSGVWQIERASRLLKQQADEITRLRNRWAMIDKLRAEEGHSVELIHDNPDFGGPNCVVHVSIDYSQNHDAYYGDTIDDCLQKAVAALEAKGQSNDRP